MADLSLFDGEEVLQSQSVCKPSKIFKMVRRNDVEGVRAHLAGVQDINMTIGGWSMLSIACDRNHADMIRLLLVSGADVSVKAPNSEETALEWIAMNNYELYAAAKRSMKGPKAVSVLDVPVQVSVPRAPDVCAHTECSVCFDTKDLVALSMCGHEFCEV